MNTAVTTPPPKPTSKNRILDWVLATVGFLAMLTAIILLYLMLTAVDSQPATLPFDPSAAPQQSRSNLPAAFSVQTGEQTWQLTPKAHYALAARVLGAKTYRDWQTPLIPLDLALAWGDLSDPAVDEWISWRQSGRWYHYRWPAASPYDGDAIRKQSANVHIIPATENLEKALRQVNPGDVVALSGYLVDVETIINGRTQLLPTSLTRDDSGGGACEIFYVSTLVVNGRRYE